MKTIQRLDNNQALRTVDTATGNALTVPTVQDSGWEVISGPANISISGDNYFALDYYVLNLNVNGPGPIVLRLAFDAQNSPFLNTNANDTDIGQNFVFSCVMNCSNGSPTVEAKLCNLSGACDQSNTRTLVGSLWDAVRSNTMMLETLDYNADDYAITLTISEHSPNFVSETGENLSKILISTPNLVNDSVWANNPVIQNMRPYLPDLYQSYDSQEVDPTYPFFRLVDVLTDAIADTMFLYSEWFQHYKYELPANFDENDLSIRSRLTDPNNVRSEYLNWVGQFSGNKVVKQIYNSSSQAIVTDTDLFKIKQLKPAIYGTGSGKKSSVVTAAEFGVSDTILGQGTITAASYSAGKITYTSASHGITLGAYLTVENLLPAAYNVQTKKITAVTTNTFSVDSTNPGVATDVSGNFTAISGNKTVVVSNGYKSDYRGNVKVASTGNVVIASALEAGDVIDGITLVAGDKVLLKNQTTTHQNGVYTVVASSAGAASRSTDFDTGWNGTTGEIKLGATFTVAQGTEAGKTFQVTTSGNITIGTTPIEFSLDTSSPWNILVSTLGSKTIDVDYRGTVKAATTNANITLSGTQTIDGVSLVAGDRVLVKNQSTTHQNGVYEVGASTWSRADDFNTGWNGTTGEIKLGATFVVTQGTVNADKAFKMTTSGNITIGTTGIEFSAFTGSENILLLVENARPMGYKIYHNIVDQFTLTLGDSTYGVLGTAVL